MKKHLLCFLILVVSYCALPAQPELFEVQMYRKASNTIAGTTYMYAPKGGGECAIKELIALSDQNELFKPSVKPIAKLPEGKSLAVAMFNSSGDLQLLADEEFILLTYFQANPTTLCKECGEWKEVWKSVTPTFSAYRERLRRSWF